MLFNNIGTRKITIFHKSQALTSSKAKQHMYSEFLFGHFTFLKKNVSIFLVFGHAIQYVGSQFPNQGLSSRPLHWKESLPGATTGLPGKSLTTHFNCHGTYATNGSIPETKILCVQGLKNWFLSFFLASTFNILCIALVWLTV